jgi:hypothetical protein
MFAVFSSRPAPPVRYDGTGSGPASIRWLVRYSNMIHPRAIYSRRLLALLALAWCPAALRAAEAPSTFEREIAPILRTHCRKCPSGVAPKNEPDLTHRDGRFKGVVRGLEIAAQVRRAVWPASQRDPVETEAQAAQELVRKHGPAPPCRAPVNANEFVFVN